ncbi:DUF5667 domain-containing protein [Paenibacillus harenae]|uniref:DUF5667 domain-containing protein n=1 Tax=Paenibacillus harenae TaxID=306543 RepID=UPI000401DBE4|nr:DUF5667 domain-containing protein [Paenibacillus harenae]
MSQEQKGVKLLTKGMVLSMLVFSMGTGSSFASTDTDAAAEISVTVKTDASENETAAPSLLPGDFFYFIKTAYENIRLFIANDDLQEAKLHSQFAQERLSEANALFLNGENEKSERVLQKSLENQQLAVELTASEPVESDKDGKLEEVVLVKTDLQHNILALTAALEKKKNPQAQQSLLKNIIKSFGHLEKKLAKLEEKATAKQVGSTDASTEANSDTVVSGTDQEIPSNKTEKEQEAATGSLLKAKPEKAERSKGNVKSDKIVKNNINDNKQPHEKKDQDKKEKEHPRDK